MGPVREAKIAGPSSSVGNSPPNVPENDISRSLLNLQGQLNAMSLMEIVNLQNLQMQEQQLQQQQQQQQLMNQYQPLPPLQQQQPYQQQNYQTMAQQPQLNQLQQQYSHQPPPQLGAIDIRSAYHSGVPLPTVPNVWQPQASGSSSMLNTMPNLWQPPADLWSSVVTGGSGPSNQMLTASQPIYQAPANIDVLFPKNATAPALISPSNTSDSTSYQSSDAQQLNKPPSIDVQFCSSCDSIARVRCMDCEDVMCADCHGRHDTTHECRNVQEISPIGSMPGPSSRPVPFQLPADHCDLHGKPVSDVCDECNVVICGQCKMVKHAGHRRTPIADYAANAGTKLRGLIDTSCTGIALIRQGIDRAVALSQSFERDYAETSMRIRKSMRLFVQYVEDRERLLLELAETHRYQTSEQISQHMQGLRSSLAALADDKNQLEQTVRTGPPNLSDLEMTRAVLASKARVASYTKVLNVPLREEFMAYVGPTYDVLQSMRMLGEVCVSETRIMSEELTRGPATPFQQHQQQQQQQQTQLVPHQQQQQQQQQQLVPHYQRRRQSAQPMPNSMITVMPACDPSVMQRTCHANRDAVRCTDLASQAIWGHPELLTVKLEAKPSLTFAIDGSRPGDLSRPWGVCVDHEGNIITGDRRNNRVQVFYPNGTCKFHFGTKGTANGEFDLPAGICTDRDHNIYVVDKDNHRVQVFNETGQYLLKFGTYGSDVGQFQYPWDVAVNSRFEVVVSDSRNHRIQMFTGDGRFLTRFQFDNFSPARMPKGLTTPRGICFTPKGDVIVSDFENHRLLLVDEHLSKVISVKGVDTNEYLNLSRPSGVCCDDDGRVIVTDSKNQRVLVFSPDMDFIYSVDVRPTYSTDLAGRTNPMERDRPCDVAILPDGRLVVMVEASPETREAVHPQKTFCKIY